MQTENAYNHACATGEAAVVDEHDEAGEGDTHIPRRRGIGRGGCRVMEVMGARQVQLGLTRPSDRGAELMKCPQLARECRWTHPLWRGCPRLHHLDHLDGFVRQFYPRSLRAVPCRRRRHLTRRRSRLRPGAYTRPLLSST